MDFNEQHETGMGFQIFKFGASFYVFDGKSFYKLININFSDLGDQTDESNLVSVESPFSANPEIVLDVYKSRREAYQAALIHVTAKTVISRSYTGAFGAVPLLKKYRLVKDTTFFRAIWQPKDFRFVGGSLAKGTYLIPENDSKLFNTGFGGVGRYALPIPLPCIHIYKYVVPAYTIIEVGTVEPLFGQSGGGVEVRLFNKTVVTQTRQPTLNEW